MDRNAKQDRVKTEREAFETTVFRSGNSDAVRLPKRLGLAGRRVRVRVRADGRLVIEPAKGRQWPTGFLASFGRLTGYFELPSGLAGASGEEERVTPSFDETKGNGPR